MGSWGENVITIYAIFNYKKNKSKCQTDFDVIIQLQNALWRNKEKTHRGEQIIQLRPRKQSENMCVKIKKEREERRGGRAGIGFSLIACVCVV